MDPCDQVELLRRQFHQLQDPSGLSFPAPEILKLPTIQSRIYETMFREGNLTYPPPAHYRLRVLKRLIDALEHDMSDPEEDEIQNSLAEALGALVSEPPISESDRARRKTFVTFTAPHDLGDERVPSVTLLESPSLLAAEGVTGLRTWEAALHLATFLDSLAGRPWVQDRNVLELGAGTGLVSLLCAKHLGAQYVMATDGSSEVIHDLVANLGFNELADSSRIKTRVLKWGHTLADEVLDPAAEKASNESTIDFRYDLIIGADVTYDERSIKPLVCTLCDLFSRYPQSKALISATLRNEETFANFLNMCQDEGLEVKRLDTGWAHQTKQSGFFYSTEVEIALMSVSLGRRVKAA